MEGAAVQVDQVTVDKREGRFPSFPVDIQVILTAEKELTQRSGRIDEVAEILLEDPVTVLELLSVANRVFHANDKPAIWSVKVALVRLGTSRVIETLRMLRERESDCKAEVRTEFERLRLRARRVATVARSLVDKISPQTIEESQTAALMFEVGFMCALMRYKDRYIKVLKAGSGKGLSYRLEKELHANIDKLRLDYLTDRLFPISLLSVFDPEVTCKTELDAQLKFITEAANELVEAAEQGKLGKYAPKLELPVKSPLRYLDLSAVAREQIYVETAELFGIELNVGRATSRSMLPSIDEVPAEKPAVTEVVPEELQTPLVFFQTEVEFVESTDEDLNRPHTHFSPQNQRVFEQLKELVDAAESTEELIAEVLNILTENGPFKRASLIQFDKRKGVAQLLCPTGTNFTSEDQLLVKDPLSPVARASTQIRSFNSEVGIDPLSPMGVNAFAFSPLRIESGDRIALYADCGDTGGLPFESRRVFRTAVGLLNRLLPNLPGGIPE